jgi:hypothetical protein
MTMEKIQSHEIKDIWRVRDGLLIEIHKYESLGYSVYGRDVKTKVIRGCKKLKELKEDYTDTYCKKTYPKGILIYGSTPVKPITDVSQFKVEIKSSGGSIYGDIKEIEKVLKSIEEIIDKYR